MTLDYLGRYLDTRRVREPGKPMPPIQDHGLYLESVRMLGQRTAELHRALALPTQDPDFAPEAWSDADMAALKTALGEGIDRAFEAIKGALSKLDDAGRTAADHLLPRKAEAQALIAALADGGIHAAKTRIHGDYHLAQVLVVQNDFFIVDFEGEPGRPLADRRAKNSALKDVAGMLRSFDYAAHAAHANYAEGMGEAADKTRPLLVDWARLAKQRFLESYAETVGDAASWPADRDERQRLLTLFLLEKAAYEVLYEAGNRPAWLPIAMRGLEQILDEAAHEPDAAERIAS
jgi:maltose alpha-D-glucosyltransferase/alpha-amylase